MLVAREYMVEEYFEERNILKYSLEEQETNIFLIESFFNTFGNKNKQHFNKALMFICNIIDNTSPWMIANICLKIYSLMEQNMRGQMEYGYKIMLHIVNNYSNYIKITMPVLIPILSNHVNDVNPVVKTMALEVLTKLLKCSGNNDLNVFIPSVLIGLKNFKAVDTCVDDLASCVFVQAVEAPALAIITPILYRALNDKTYATRRKACIIIDNMCKLIEHPKEIQPFYDRMKKQLEICCDTTSDPEVRNVSNRALNTLKSCCDENIHISYTKSSANIKVQLGQKVILDNITNLEYFTKLVCNLYNTTVMDKEQWEIVFNNNILYNEPINTHELMEFMYEDFINSLKVKEDVYEDMDEGKDLYKGEFSLAYGALTLLNNTSLHLKQNRFYGLLGPNNCGKTTLMRAIANEQIEGFPKKDELKTVFVEHEIPEMEVGEDDKGFPIFNIDLCGVEWVVHCCNEIYHLSPPVDRTQVEKVMEDIGFGNAKKDIGKDRAADMEMGVTTYSGGWKMKMQLCAATLMNADILMLDEPTGHLDVTNVAWIKQWLKNFRDKGGSIITTSHDTGFLNEMCSHIIDFQNRKLKTFKGITENVLEEFVEKYPEKKGYFELKNDVVKFKFPEPGPLEGVKSMSKTILKMKDVTFQYPSRDTPTITNINIECSRISRVGVIGANGAGKSTAIKILIGELKTNQGEVIKHPGMRIAYIAQHAFFHLEKHLNKTPTQYIMWRFAGNEDKEGLDMLNKDTEEKIKVVKYYLDTDEMQLKVCDTLQQENKALFPEAILGRRDNKKEKTKEYEVKWKDKPIESAIFVKREILIKMGAIKLVQRQDEKEAVMAGLASKTLTTKDIEKHFADFGIDTEQANHTLIKSLSGGQKVKIVLAASLWQNPHIVILDEPTNYLDRDGLGALTNAIHQFNGGVVIISHNREFTNAVVQEKWIMEKGNLRKEGESNEKEEKKEHIINKDEIVYDSFGNEIKIEKQVQLSDKDKKKELKSLQKQLKDGKKRKILTDDEIYDLEEKIEQFKIETTTK
jgi:elongation factor 3